MSIDVVTQQLTRMARFKGVPEDIIDALRDTMRHRSRHIARSVQWEIKKTHRAASPLKFGVVDYSVRHHEGHKQVRITIVTESGATTLDVPDTDAFAEALIDRLFAAKDKNMVWFCPAGKTRFVEYLKSHLMKGLAAHGYTMSGVRINAPETNVTIMKDKLLWRVADFNECHGVTLSGSSYDASTLDDGTGDPEDMLTRFYNDICHIRDFYLKEFGISMKQTVASTGFTAIVRHMTEGTAFQRPTPDVHAICREGATLRQGYLRHDEFIGVASEEDQRRQYASILKQDLPLRGVYDHAVINGERQKGIFLCRVSGQGMFPIYLGVHDPKQGVFIKEYWHGGNAICWLPDTEYEGIEAAGYTIEPIWGYRFTEWTHVRPFVDKLQDLVNEHTPDSPTGQVLKLLGNATIGRFSTASDMNTYVYSTEDQPDLMPLQDVLTREQIPNVWEKQQKTFSAKQQPHIAAYIYGATRTEIYKRMMMHITEGRRVLHACTDGLIIEGSLEDVFYPPNPQFGEWVRKAESVPTAILGNNQYIIGEKEKNMGGGSTTLMQEAFKAIKVAPAPTPAAEAPTVAFLSDLYKAVAGLDLRTAFVQPSKSD